jgi:putative endonuclease
MREYHFYVYILQSASRRALYIGMTNNLRHRVFQHKTQQFEGFTDDYNAIRLVYWENFGSVGNAIAREKQLKRWRREKKMWLIETMNPKWRTWPPTGFQHKVSRLRSPSARRTASSARDDNVVVIRSYPHNSVPPTLSSRAKPRGLVFLRITQTRSGIQLDSSYSSILTCKLYSGIMAVHSCS